MKCRDTPSTAATVEGRGNERMDTMKYGEFPLIGRDELTDLSMLRDHVLYSDEIEDMTKDEQNRVYDYCKVHANLPACLENLRQIRYAVARIYFGY